MKLDKNQRVPYLLLAALAVTLLLPQILVAYSSSPVAVGSASSSSIATSSAIIVPDDYPTISAAVGNASQGATVLLRKGTYYENPVINKALSIVGEDSKNTIIVGDGGVDRGARAVFTVTADNVELSGLTIQSLNYSKPALHATGIIVSGDNCTIIDNNIVGTYLRRVLLRPILHDNRS